MEEMEASENSEPNRLSRRERQIQGVVYRLGEATVAQVREALPAPPPTYSTVRALLRVMENKGLVSHRDEGGRYVYTPTTPARPVGIAALRQVVQNFFSGSVEQAVTTLLTERETRLSPEEAARLSALLTQAMEISDETNEKGASDE
jgi:predicted transcriptional regulator